MKKSDRKQPHTLEPMEPRLLFSAGLEGMLAGDALTTTTALLSPEVAEQMASDPATR